MSLPAILYPILLHVHVLVCLFLILLVLVQCDKRGDLAGALGGMSNAAFTGSGASNLLTTLTKWVALVSFVIILLLNVMSSQVSSSGNEKSELQKSKTALPIQNQVPGLPGSNVLQGIPQVGDVPSEPAQPAPVNP